MEASRRIAPLCGFRKRYGDTIAGIIEIHSTQLARRTDRHSSQEIKATLQAISSDPAAADLQRMGALTSALLMDHAWRRLRIESLNALTVQQLAECAKYALDHFPRFKKPVVEQAELTMTLALLAAAAAFHAARRNHLLREALSWVFSVEYPRATAVIKQAHREMHARAARA